MRLLNAVTASCLLLAAAAGEKPRLDLEGPATYEKSGVRVDGRLHPWKDLASLADVPPAPPAVAPKPGAREALAGKTASDKSSRTALAAWCRSQGLPDEEARLLGEALAEDGWYAPALEAMRRRVERRWPATLLAPPFEGTWLAAPDTTKHHQKKSWALWAIDFVKVDASGAFATANPPRNEDFLDWGQPVLAAADGTVAEARDNYPDIPAGKMGKPYEANRVLLQHEGGEFTEYGHLQQGSVPVKAGDRVRRGQPIGKIGNSGGSGMPHLHFALMIQAPGEGGKSAWISVPFVFEGFEAQGVRMRRARPQEGWILSCPKPAPSPPSSPPPPGP